MKPLFNSIRKFIVLGILLLLLFAFFYFHVYRYMSFDTMKTYKAVVQEWTNQHYTYAVILYLLLFSTLIACAIPCATFLCLVGGMLFGLMALLYAEFSTAFGGFILFLAIRTAIGSHIAEQTTGWIKTMESGFQENAFNYLLSLRLVPIFPCWISNIAAGALNVRIRTFLAATLIGIFPSTFIYVLAGRSLNKLLTDKNTPVMNLIFTPSVLFPLLGLAILSLLPVVYKIIKKSRSPQ